MGLMFTLNAVMANKMTPWPQGRRKGANDMAIEQSPIDPIAGITDERFNHAITILRGAQDERSPARERIEALAQELERLLGEIELFRHVVYCGQAAGCLLENHVLRVLAGSVIWENGSIQTWKKKKIFKDKFWNKPSPAAKAALNRDANGLEEWKDRGGRSIKAIRKKKAHESKKANEPDKKS